MKLMLALLFSFSLFGAPSENYFDLLASTPKSHGIIGNHEKGEIEILLHPLSINEAETIAMERLLNKGIAPEYAWEWSRVGIIAEYQYLFWLRDGVIFPSGEMGTYDRILWKSELESPPGVAIFPYLADRKVVLILNYRHATRSWELELPRGLLKEGETVRIAATRELQEETGYHVDDSLLLGTMAIDSGILATVVPVLACRAIDPSDRKYDFSEAIASTVILSVSDLEKALLKGFLDISLPERTLRANVRDPFLTYALLQMKLRHWQD